MFVWRYDHSGKMTKDCCIEGEHRIDNHLDSNLVFALIDMTEPASLQIIFGLDFGPIIIKSNPLHARLNHVYCRLKGKS